MTRRSDPEWQHRGLEVCYNLRSLRRNLRYHYATIRGPWGQTSGSKFSSLLVYRLPRPKQAVTQLITNQNMRFDQKKKLWDYPFKTTHSFFQKERRKILHFLFMPRCENNEWDLFLKLGIFRCFLRTASEFFDQIPICWLRYLSSLLPLAI